MIGLRQAQLWWHTVRYLRPAQIGSRLRLQAGAIWRRRFPERAQRAYVARARGLGLLPADVSGRVWPLPEADPAAVAASNRLAGEAVAGEFCYLEDRYAGGRPVRWEAPGRSQLWRYHLQYGGYLVDVAVQPDHGWSAAAALMREWIAANPLGRVRDAWHPFVVSERVVNWIFAIQWGAPSIDAVGDDILASLAAQCVFVSRNLETDVSGNHLLKNLKAMCVAGCFWRGPGADPWRAACADRFGRELDNQLLADGAHYERSPMYHALVLEDALEVIGALRSAGAVVPEHLAGAARAMIDYLPHALHPDGEIALFNDSVFGEGSAPAALLAFGARVLAGEAHPGSLTVRQASLTARLPLGGCRGSRAVPRDGRDDGGLVRLPVLEGRGVAIVDVGPACPDDLPAHAHADIFSFEASVDGTRFVVDSGVGEYAAGPWRDFYRSTRAHNTVEVAGQEQIECWSSFRVARRARIHGRRAVDGPFLQGVTAVHDGYARLSRPVRVRRSFLALAGRAWLVIDRLDGAASWWRSFVHAAPDIDVELHDGTRAVLASATGRLSVAWFGPCRASLTGATTHPIQGWYAPRFGQALPAHVLVLEGEGALPVVFGYILAPDTAPDGLRIDVEGEVLEIAVESFTCVVSLANPDVPTVTVQ